MRNAMFRVDIIFMIINSTKEVVVMAQKGGFDVWGKKYGLILAIVVGLIVWFLPMPADMTVTQHKLLSLFAGAVVAWITIGINFAVSTFAIITLLYFWVGNLDGKEKAGALVHDASFALSGFGSASLWLLLTGFVISIAMTESGVAKRLALHMMKKFGKTPMGAMFATIIANFIIAPLTPSNTARTAAMLPIIQGIAQTYKCEPGKSNFGKALYICGAFTSNITASTFLTGTIPNPLALALISAAVGASFMTTWSFWALAAIPTNIIILIIVPFLLLGMYKPEHKTLPGGLAYVDEELAKMGPMSLPEKKAILYFLIALVLWSTDFIHHFNSSYVAFFVALLIFMPRIGVLDWKKTQNSLPWELFMYFGGVITLSTALMKTGAFKLIIEKGLGALGLYDMNYTILFIFLLGFTIFSHIIWSTTTAMAGVMIPIYIGIAQAMGFDVVKFVLPMSIMLGYALCLPFNTMGNIIMFGDGYFTIPDLLKSGLIMSAIIWICWIVTAFVYWPFIGL